MTIRVRRALVLLALGACAATVGASLAGAAGTVSLRAQACPVGTADADGNPANGCEVNLRTDLSNCGAVGVQVPPNGSCRNGVPVDAKGKPVAAAAPAATTTAAAPAKPAAPPATFDFTLASDPKGVTDGLAKSQGEPSCTGQGAALTCVQAMGTKGTYAESVGVKDNATGSSGRMAIDCSYMYSGTTTTYASRDGKSDATGSQDCTLAFTLDNGDTVNGSLHEQRVQVANHETMTFTVTFTGGGGRYAGFQGSFSSSREQDWTPPSPIGQKGQDIGPQSGGDKNGGNQAGGGKQATSCPAGFADVDGNPANGCEVDLMTDPRNCGRVGNTVSAGSTCVGGVPTGNGPTRTTQARSAAAAVARALAGRVAVKRATRPLADFATVGLLVPSNRPLAVKVAAAPGSTCSGGFTGAKGVALAPATADAKGIATFPTVPAGAFTARTTVTAKVTCRAPGALAAATVERKLRAFAVLGK